MFTNEYASFEDLMSHIRPLLTSLGFKEKDPSYDYCYEPNENAWAFLDILDNQIAVGFTLDSFGSDITIAKKFNLIILDENNLRVSHKLFPFIKFCVGIVNSPESGKIYHALSIAIDKEYDYYEYQ